MGLAALLLTTWSACSDDTDIPGGENPEEARAYTTVTIAVPNGVAETRAGTTADTDDNTTEAGSEDGIQSEDRQPVFVSGRSG